jgi:pyruvate carboxylase subunit B
MKFETTVDDETTELQLDPEATTFSVSGSGNDSDTDSEKNYAFHHQPNGRHLLRVGHQLYKIDNVAIEGRTVEFTLNGRRCSVDVRDERDLLLGEMGFKTAAEIGEGELKAPMPGKILEIMVKEGDEVELGQPVAILEAMKMENELKAPVAGTVVSIEAAVNNSLEKNALILEIEAIG